MTGVDGGGHKPAAFHSWVCTACGATLTTPLPVSEVTHPCKRDITKKQKPMKGVS